VKQADVELQTLVLQEQVLLERQYKDYVLVLLFIKYISDKYADVPYAPITIPKGASFKDMVALKGKPDIGDQINKKIIANNDVKRGDVMVFRYPEDPTTDFIKRVVGVPGDEVAYINQKLYINGQLAPTQPVDNFYDDSGLQRVYRPRFTEKLGEKEHQILVQPNAQHIFRPDRADGPFPFQENCRYTVEGVTCKVPAGNYFMMGDNRDNSRDSRYWGFVPDENIVGKAFLVWMNFGNLKRIGTFFD